ncbi:MAG: hypothetical protein LBF93_04695 [Zoogloeaceae bacterium]|jgi:hypothetical protein|nr:hypothetical protein [Zoogloeaceae bacterium]
MKKALQRAAGAWGRLTLAERHQLVGAICFLMAFCYGLLIWQPGYTKLNNLIYKEQKQKVRDRVTGKNDAALKNLNLDGLDARVTQRELAKVRETLAALETERERLLARFVPLDDLETLQAMKSGLARLAENGDMEVTALEHIYHSSGGHDRPPTPELLKSESEKSPYKRPLLRLKAKASYWGLMQFLDGLSSSLRVAAPVWSDISVKVEKARSSNSQNVFGAAEAPKQWLEVEIHLAI